MAEPPAGQPISGPFPDPMTAEQKADVTRRLAERFPRVDPGEFWTCAAGPPAGDVQRFDDDVATAVTAIADIEKLLEDDDGPLGWWHTTEFRKQLKAMKTRLNTMADRYAEQAET